MYCFLRVTSGILRNSLYVLTVIYHEIISMFHIQLVVVPFLRNNPCAVMFLQRFIFSAKKFWKNIRSALGFFIAGIPFVKNPGISFLHFRLRWCSFTWKRSCFAILGEISWERSTYRLKFEHEHLGKCFRNSLIRQCHNYVDKVKSVKKKPRGFPNRGERYGAKYENWVLLLLLWSRKTINVLMFTFRRMSGEMFSNL